MYLVCRCCSRSCLCSRALVSLSSASSLCVWRDCVSFLLASSSASFSWRFRDRILWVIWRIDHRAELRANTLYMHARARVCVCVCVHYQVLLLSTDSVFLFHLNVNIIDFSLQFGDGVIQNCLVSVERHSRLATPSHHHSYFRIQSQIKCPLSRMHQNYSSKSCVRESHDGCLFAECAWTERHYSVFCDVTDLSSSLSMFSSSLTLVSDREMTSSWTLELWRSCTSKRSSRSFTWTRGRKGEMERSFAHFPLFIFTQGQCCLYTT